jgi:hypothetical protein
MKWDARFSHKHSKTMSLATLTSKELSRIQKLIERKEALAQQIVEINSELEAIDSGVSETARPTIPAVRAATAPRAAKAAAPAVPGRTAKRGKTVRGQLKERISRELKSAGNQGMKVQDLATRIGTGYANITTFFQSTGKKIKEIKKVGRGQYAWRA